MKKKLLALLSLGLLVFASVNNSACSSDDDDDNGGVYNSIDTLDIQSALEQGTEDGKAYAEAYAEVKANGVLSTEGILAINTMVTYGKKYKSNQSKTYKGAFLVAANGIGDATVVENMLANSTSFKALQTLLGNLFSSED